MNIRLLRIAKVLLNSLYQLLKNAPNPYVIFKILFSRENEMKNSAIDITTSSV
jgi:hypothetical protein